MNTNALENIHKNLVDGNRRDMADGIDGYGLYDFWADYARYLSDIYTTTEMVYGYFRDAVISYHRIKSRWEVI